MDSDVLIVSYDTSANTDMSAIVAVRREGDHSKIVSYFVGEDADKLYKVLTREERDAL